MITIDLRPVPLDDDAALDEYAAVQRTALGYERPHFTPTDPTVLKSVLRSGAGRARHEITGAWAADSLIGAALTYLPMRDNLDVAWVFPFVVPDARGRGVGRALTEAALTAAVAADRRVILAEVEVDGGPTVAEAHDLSAMVFARAMGFHVNLREVRRELTLPADPRRLAALDARATGASGYVIETHEGLPPEADLPAILRLMGLVGVDAPSGEVDFEPEDYPLEGYLADWRNRVAAGMTRLTVVARGAEGDVVAFSTQVAPAGPELPIGQMDTYVDRTHRGHGLGAAMKAASTRWWMANQPARPGIRTCNAEANAHMVAINEEAGFVPIETIFSLVRRV